MIPLISVSPGDLWCSAISASRRLIPRLARTGYAVLIGAAATGGLFLGGCTTERTPLTASGYTFLTGNWVLQLTPASGGTQFTQLAGFIDEENTSPGVKDDATAAFQDQGQNCFLGADFIPFYGDVAGNTVFFYSFDVNGEYVTLNATKDATATHMTGTYSIGGGCINGATGTFTGTRYAMLKGAYAGSMTANAAQLLQLTLAQNTTATGDGNFFISGTAVFQGFGCFTSGTMAAANGSIVGNAVQLAFTANDGSTVTLNGTIDPLADTLTISSGAIVGDTCAGPLGSATLALQ